ncbi:CD225/dispanin family protein [Verrucomicrobiales bacterium BCK34]|nr:CD225/dispanin family protein [Verrucomicrobiales bacterium BCK34]
MEWYYASNGQQQGPVSQEQLMELFQKGEVKTSDLVWNETMTDWVPFGNVPSLSQAGAATGGAAPASAAPAQSPAPSSAAPRSAPAVASTMPATGGENIPNYLWQSIVCMVLCCLPLAIPALIFATKVKPAIEMGKLDEARDASKKAKMWCWIAFGVGLVVQVLYLGLVAVGAMAEAGALQ